MGLGNVLIVVQISPMACIGPPASLPSSSSREIRIRSSTHEHVMAWVAQRKNAVKKVRTWGILDSAGVVVSKHGQEKTCRKELSR